jgi:hypothetical protein
MRISTVYHVGVLWLLSVIGKGAVESIYNHGHDDGAHAMREHMRQELLDLQASLAKDRARSYQQGFTDALRLTADDEPSDAAKPAERVM